MKILFITLLLPHPHADHASAFTVLRTIRNLSKRHEIYLVSFVRSEKEREYARYIEPYCTRVETVLLAQNNFRKFRARANLFTLIPLAVSNSYSREMRDRINSIVTKDRFDVVQFEYTPMGQYVSEIRDVPAVINVHDMISVTAKNFVENLSLSRKKLEWYADSLVSSRYEAKLYERFDRVIAISDKVKEHLLKCNPSLNVSVIPPGVDIPDIPKIHSSGKGSKLIFMGAMWRYENINAVLYFYHSVFALIRKAVPEATLCIVGGSPSEEIKKLSTDPAVKITGYVDDILPYYLESDISIAPMRMGGGVQCKILDAMASGLPVVTTTQGNEGICATHNKEILVADAPEVFANYTIELIKDSGLRKTISEGGVSFVRNNFGWDQIIDRLEVVYNECLL